MNRLLGYIVTFLMLLFVFDGVLRLAGCGPKPAVVEFDAQRGWANRKGVTVHRSMSEFATDYTLNSHGMRGHETTVEKPAGQKRILFVGDSFTLGFTVDDEKSFVRVLERDLRANGHDVEALNGGTEGYSTDQELLFLQLVGKQFQPDYVVFAPYLNDVHQNTIAKYAIREKPLFKLVGTDVAPTNLPLATPVEKTWLERSTALGNLAYNIRNPQKLATIPRAGKQWRLEDCPLLIDAPVEVEEAWTMTAALVKKIAAETVAMGAKPVALIIPNRWEIHADAPLPVTLPGATRADLDPAKPTNRFAAICQEAGFVVVDPRPKLLAEAGKGTTLYFMGQDFHFNADGFQLAAGALLERFVQPDLLGPGTGKVLSETLHHAAEPALKTWQIVVLALWLVLGTAFWKSYKRENPLGAFLKVGLLIGFVTSVFLGIGKLAALLPPAAAKWLFPAIIGGLIVFVIVKIGQRFSVITELYGTFVRRGHWYMLPMLVVMLSIGMLLVVAASSPFVAPFIYTLF
jgi:Family of unknown function (DUF5989)/GDSL-like Lipase/Acylhydrolase family